MKCAKTVFLNAKIVIKMVAIKIKNNAICVINHIAVNVALNYSIIIVLFAKNLFVKIALYNN
jgi:hypothetical protein